MPKAKSNRTYYTFPVTISARERGAVQRYLNGKMVVDDFGLTEGVLQQILTSTKRVKR